MHRISYIVYRIRDGFDQFYNWLTWARWNRKLLIIFPIAHCRGRRILCDKNSKTNFDLHWQCDRPNQIVTEFVIINLWLQIFFFSSFFSLSILLFCLCVCVWFQAKNEKPVSKSDAWDYATLIGAKYIETSSRANVSIIFIHIQYIWILCVKCIRVANGKYRVACVDQAKTIHVKNSVNSLENHCMPLNGRYVSINFCHKKAINAG